MKLAQNLFTKIDRLEDNDLIDFISELGDFIKSKIGEIYSDEHLIGSIYKENAVFKNNEFSQLCKCQVILAYKRLLKLKEKHTPESGWPSYTREFVRELLFDLKDYVETIDNNKEDSFIAGWKSRGDMSYVVFGEASNLFYSSLSEKGASISHRGALNLSVFGLRQSLEVRFKRAIGVSRIFDNPMNEAKLRHEFFADFIDNNRDLISLRINSLKELMKIYKWTNYSVHNGGLAKIWEVDFAFDYCSDLFRPEPMTAGSWSVHSSIIIQNYAELKSRLEQSVQEELPKNNWSFLYSGKPEALVKS